MRAPCLLAATRYWTLISLTKLKQWWDKGQWHAMLFHNQKHQFPDAKGTNRFEVVKQSLKLSFILESLWKNHHQSLKLCFHGGILLWENHCLIEEDPYISHHLEGLFDVKVSWREFSCKLDAFGSLTLTRDNINLEYIGGCKTSSYKSIL